MLRVEQQRARDGDALFLPAAKGGAAFAHRCIVALGNDVMKSCAAAAWAASITSSRLASGRPKAMLSRMVPENSVVSCKTIPMLRAQAGQRHVAHVAPIDQHRALHAS